MKKELLSIKLKLDNPTSTQPRENYADKVKIIRNETQTKYTTKYYEQDKTVILTTYCSSRQIRKSEKRTKSKNRLLPYIQTKSYCTHLLQRMVVYNLSSKQQRTLTVYCRDGSPNFLGATRRFGELVTEMNSTALQ